MPTEQLTVDESTDADQPEPAPSRRRRWFVAALVGVMALAVGFGAGVFTARPGWPGDDSAEAGFARDMSRHHAQAVSMATTEYRATADPELRQIAVDIALTQQAQIGTMSTWLETWGLGPTGRRSAMAWMPEGQAALSPDGLMPGMATDQQLAELRAATGKAKDLLFCQLMIQHHLGGIHMVDGILQKSENPQVTELAQQMKDAQQSEINALQAKLTKLRGGS